MGMFRDDLEKVTPYQPGKPIEEVKRALGLKEVYKLASNEIPFSPLYIRKAILKELPYINRYPESGCFCLRKELAQKMKVDEAEIVLGNGSDELIVLTLRATIGKDDEVIVAYPTFLIYEIQAQIQGAQIVRVPLKEMKYSLQDIAAKVSNKTKVIFIANPDNPTGTYVNQREVEVFLESIPQHILVFFDEAYFEFAPKDFPKTDAFLRKRGNIIYSRTFSKVYGLAGLRLGYAVTTVEIAGVLNKIREPFNINRFAQVAAVAALRNKKFLAKTLSYIQQEKRYLYKELKKMEICFFESATNFILIDFKTTTKELYEYLLRKGVIVRELRGWGLANFFRVTVGLHKENKKFIDCFRGYIEKKGERG
ncbi:MAG: histidinol-phosphate transaminase [Candidatus Omnitrophota bacterium]